ncbi:hypothetical protein LOK49_LG01G03199, partial [Camellia lanceoleosa]
MVKEAKRVKEGGDAIKLAADGLAKDKEVLFDANGIEKVVETINDSIPIIEWDFEGTHYFDNGPVTVQYLLVLDALNFCFGL